MKRFALIVVLSVLTFAAPPVTAAMNGEVTHNQSVARNASSFSDGWYLGWEAGWKYVKGKYSIAPIAPIPPLPRPGQNTFQDGYNRGFVAGMAKALER
jgi:hypothetical protein